MDARLLLAFTLDEQWYALSLTRIRQVVRMVEITPLPKAPAIVLGVISLSARIIPVLDMRGRFGLSKKIESSLSDQLIVAETSARTVALVVDFVVGVFERPSGDIIKTDTIVPGVTYVEGVTRLRDEVTLIHNLDRFLSIEENDQLGEALTISEGRQ